MSTASTLRPILMTPTETGQRNYPQLLCNHCSTVQRFVTGLVRDLSARSGTRLSAEFDTAEREPGLRRRSDGSYDVDGGVPLSALNEIFGGAVTSDEVETIGGLVLERLNRAPKRGDSVEIAGYVVEVTRVDGTRVSTVRIAERADDEVDGESTDE